jgi:catechol 2,3-dioxygenase-like lactoylglutathione lyase family enzyme
MRLLCLLAASTATMFAQTAAPNDSGIAIGHVHLMVADMDVHKKLWVDVLGGQDVKLGILQTYKLPGVFIVVQKARMPLEGSDGSTVNHFGFLVKSYADIKTKLSGAGLTFTMDNANNKQLIAEFPDKVRVEFTEDANLKTPIAFHHIHIATQNQEKQRDWYVKLFGGNSGMRGQFPAAKFPGGEVDFLKAQAAVAPTKGRALDHIGFEVKDLEAFCKKLAADGMQFDMAYRQIAQIDNLKIAFIIDPEGTRIELTEGLNTH